MTLSGRAPRLAYARMQELVARGSTSHPRLALSQPASPQAALGSLEVRPSVLQDSGPLGMPGPGLSTWISSGKQDRQQSVPREAAYPAWPLRGWAEHSNQPSGLRGALEKRAVGCWCWRSLNPGEFRATAKWPPK